jgi:hypothetical protein
MPEHTRTREGEALGATVLFPGGREGAVVRIDPHFLPKNVRQREAERLAAQGQHGGGGGGGGPREPGRGVGCPNACSVFKKKKSVSLDCFEPPQVHVQFSRSFYTRIGTAESCNKYAAVRRAKKNQDR